MNYPEYTILVNESYVALSGEVMVKLDEGWKLQGGVAVGLYNGEKIYAQAMIRGLDDA